MTRPKYPLRRLSMKLAAGISNLPNFGPNGNLTGMRQNFGWQDAMPVKCGEYIYDCTDRPELYWKAK